MKRHRSTSVSLEPAPPTIPYNSHPPSLLSILDPQVSRPSELPASEKAAAHSDVEAGNNSGGAPLSITHTGTEPGADGVSAGVPGGTMKGDNSLKHGGSGNNNKYQKLALDHDDKTDKGSTQPPSDEQVRRTVIISLSVCFFYISVSSCMVFANKAITHTFSFMATNFLLLCQMIFTAVLLRFLRSVHALDFPDITLPRAKQIAPVSVFYSLNAAVALVALRELSVPSYTLIKRLAPLVTIVFEGVLLKKVASRSIFAALLVMSAGTLIAAKADTSSSTSAWALGLASCFFQALYLIFVKRGSETGINSFGILYYHSLLSLPCISLIAAARGEFAQALNYEHWFRPAFLVVFLGSLFMGLLLNYALFLCTELTSPTSTLVSGQVKAMGQTVVGMFTFGGVDMNPRYLAGTLLNIFGGFAYAFAKLKAIRERS